MGEGGTKRIVAAFIAFHFHAGEAVLIHRKARHLNFCQVGFHRDRRKAMRARALLFEIGDVVIVKIDHAAQRFERVLHAIDFFRHHLQLVDGAVERQRGTVAIVDNAAAWCYWHQLNAVLVGTGLIIGKTDDLQIIEVSDQHAGKQQNPRKGDQSPAHKQRRLSRIVAKRIL